MTKNSIGVTLTFVEIQRLNEIAQKHIENQDYGFTPALLVRFIPDDECEEMIHVSTASFGQICESTVDKKEIEWTDVTETEKFEFI